MTDDVGRARPDPPDPDDPAPRAVGPAGPLGGGADPPVARVREVPDADEFGLLPGDTTLLDFGGVPILVTRQGGRPRRCRRRPSSGS
jgi:hypothetical protein